MELVIEIILCILVILAFIYSLKKVIKLYSKKNMVVRAKLIKKEYKDISSDPLNPMGYTNYICEYSIGDRTFQKKFNSVIWRKEFSYTNLVVNRVHGTIIITKLGRYKYVFFLLVSLLFLIALISYFLDFLG